MVSIDTNIIVRFLTHDDDTQFKKAQKDFQTENIFIPDTVILETEWVLRYAYKYTPVHICDALSKLLGLANVHLLNPHAVYHALEWSRSGLDFADAFHLAQSQHLRGLLTFNSKFIDNAKSLSPCVVKTP